MIVCGSASTSRFKIIQPKVTHEREFCRLHFTNPRFNRVLQPDLQHAHAASLLYGL